MIRQQVRDIQLSIREISERAEKRNNVVRWDIGQPSFDTPEHVKEAARKSLDEKQGYTPAAGLPELREEIAKEESMKEGIDPEPGNVMVATGGMEAIYSIFAARMDSNDSLLVNSPSWGPYGLMSAVNGNAVESVPYFDRGGDLNPGLHDRAAEADVMVVNTPSNPSGRVLSGQQARAMAELSEDSGCFLLSDEVYWRLTFEAEHHSPARFVDNSAVIGSTSKNHAMTGWRIGWLVDSEENVKEYRKVSRALTACPSRIGQRAAVEALSRDSHVDSMREEYRRRRDLVVERMDDLGWSYTSPQGAIYAFPDVERDSWSFCRDAIEEAGVAMVPGEPSGPGCETNVRICFGSAEMEQIREGFDRLEQWLR